jgi:glycolate oxidase iron-sulfur subunit
MTEHPLRSFSGPDQPAAAIYDACIRCGLCLSSCPTYLETMTETSGPRGRISLIKDVAEARLDLLSPGFVEQMSQCLDCRACEAVCPSGVAYGQLVETARAQIRRASQAQDSGAQARMQDRAMRALTGNPRLLRVVARLVRFAQRTHLTSLAGLFGLRRAAQIAPRIPDRFFVADDRRWETHDAAGIAFLHVGCVMAVAFGNVHEATVRMLQRAGLSVVAPSDQGCCGALSTHAGDPEFARKLARQNIQSFERSGADVYVVNAAGCGSALKEYGDLFAEDPVWAARAERFATRVRDVSEVLDAMDLGTPARGINATVTYQEPCHLVHAQRISKAPRRLLARIPGLRLIELEESALCCGSAGLYNFEQPEMASRLGRRKIEAIERSGASIVVTANPGCAMQIDSTLGRGSGPVVRHLVELLDEAYSAG